MPGLNTDSRYRSFIQDRDRALEHFLKNTRSRITDFCNVAFKGIQDEATILAHRREMSDRMSNRDLVKQFDRRLSDVLSYLGMHISRELQMLLKRSRTLAMVGEAEAIARVMGGAKYDVKPEPLASHKDRIEYTLNTLRYKLLKAFEQGLVLEEKTPEIIARVTKAFPKKQFYKRAPRVLKPLKEARRPKLEAEDFPEFEDEFQRAKDMASGFVTDADWQDVVSEYNREYVPQYRGPEIDLDVPTDINEYEQAYGWEIESMMNHEFVAKVRSGQDEVAKANGFEDMVWIAILDDRTDECCEWRNGLTSSEIETKLGQMDDECDAIVPPAHFNCRCTMSPFSDALPEPEKVDFGDFDQWLENQ